MDRRPPWGAPQPPAWGPPSGNAQQPPGPGGQPPYGAHGDPPYPPPPGFSGGPYEPNPGPGHGPNAVPGHRPTGPGHGPYGPPGHGPQEAPYQGQGPAAAPAYGEVDEGAPYGPGGEPPDDDPDHDVGGPGRRAARLPLPSFRRSAARRSAARPGRSSGARGPGATPAGVYFVAAGVLLILALGVVAGVVLSSHDRPTAPAPVVEAPATGLFPSTYSQASSTRVFAPIGRRTDDPKPLAAAEAFDPNKISDGESKASLRLTASKLSTRCADAVWGPKLAELLQRTGCTQATRAMYTGRGFAAMVTIFNLADTRGADQTVAGVDPQSGDGFPRPVADEAAFGQGFSTARGVAMGHYAVITWVRRANGTGSETDRGLVSLLVAIGPPPAILSRVAAGGQKQ